MPWTTEQKIFIVEAYFRQKSIHASQLQFKERFGCREFPVHEAHFMLSGHVNPTNNIFWGSTPLSAKAITLCEVQYLGCHLQTWHHSGSRTTTSGLWQSTPSDMSRCLANSGQHLVDREGRQGPLVVPAGWCQPPHLKLIIGMATAAFPWPIDQLQVWPAVGAAFTGLETPRFLYVEIPWGQGVWQQPPDYPWT